MSRKIHAEELSVGYGKRVLIPDISFSLEEGEILVLIGPNGSGKSTILKTLCRQLEAMGGDILLMENSLLKMKESDLAKKMSILLTSRPDAELMTVEDMVSTGRYPYTGRLGLLGSHDREVVRQSMELTAVDGWKDQLFEELSDGQKQRVMLARAICQEPEILVLDEPTSFLDMHHKLELLSILKMLVRERKLTVIMSLHELDLAQKIADHLLCVSEGRIDRYGTSEEIFVEDPSYIEELYQMKKGTFLPEYGSLELERCEGRPKVFVLGGGGPGIPVYRRLQREGIPFVAGILQENDLEYPVAKALAVDVVSVPAFGPVGEEDIRRAKEWIETCDEVIVAADTFGPMNEKIKELIEWQK